ncbi:MAG: DegV family protein [Clostridia bacterium]|nr:DegV family protein [Clostridia bacterium]
MYQLFIDSNCELWHTTVKELGLNVIRMPYILEGDDLIYYDMGENTDFTAFFDKMKDGAVPKTQALNEYDYIQYFEPVLARGEDIYYVTFSHKLSGTFSAMDAAIASLKEKYPEREIRTKDSKSISAGSGMISYYAALEWKKGASMDEMDAFLDDFIPHVATFFVVESLTYLYRGGRISGVTKVFGNMLGIKPIIHIDNEGELLTYSKPRTFKKAVKEMEDIVREKALDINQYKVWVLHANNEELAKQFRDELVEEFDLTDVEFQPIGPVIGAHCGPGTIAVMFHAKER